MTLLKIKTYPDPVLKKVAEPVVRFGADDQKVFNDMIETMYQADGVGLAAPQVGISKRILIASPTMTPGEEYVFVNPEIVESRGRQLSLEGCLSLPGISGEIPRAKIIHFRAQDRKGNPIEMTVKDFFARIIQHEIDHLNGVLLIDRVDFDKRQELLAAYQRL